MSQNEKGRLENQGGLFHAELERIRAAYARRQRPGRYLRIDPFTLYSTHEREREIVQLFRSEGLNSLAGMRILDVGCGGGGTLRQLLEYDADPELLFGIDLLAHNVERARCLAPHVQTVCGSATRLPFPESSFDLLLQFTLFTSVLDNSVKRAIAAEMVRVLSPRGRIIWYDFSFDNPRNPDVKGIRKSEIGELFPGFEMKARRITLAPPLGRVVAPISISLYHLLSCVRPLCTHLLCLLKRDGNKIQP